MDVKLTHKTSRIQSAKLLILGGLDIEKCNAFYRDTSQTESILSIPLSEYCKMNEFTPTKTPYILASDRIYPEHDLDSHKNLQSLRY